MRPKRIIANNDLQDNYEYYLTEPEGKNFNPEFKPELTPKEMLEMGVFGGIYMNDLIVEFLKCCFFSAKMLPVKHSNLNYFGIDASKPLSYWQTKGWIHPQDPRGWFMWYCRYYMGRRSDDDIRQIKRWKQMKRHIAQVQINCPKGFLECRKRQRQALLHWAYDSRKI